MVVVVDTWCQEPFGLLHFGAPALIITSRDPTGFSHYLMLGPQQCSAPQQFFSPRAENFRGGSGNFSCVSVLIFNWTATQSPLFSVITDEYFDNTVHADTVMCCFNWTMTLIILLLFRKHYKRNSKYCRKLTRTVVHRMCVYGVAKLAKLHQQVISSKLI